MDATDLAYWSDNSLAQLRKAVRNDEMPLPILVQLCHQWRHDGKRKEAIDLLEIRRELHDVQRPTLLLYVDLCIETGGQKQALEMADTYLLTHPDDPHVLLRRGRAYHQLGEYSSALADLQTARVRLPRAPLVLSSLSMCYAALQRWKEAHDCILLLLSDHPKHLGWHLRAAHYLRMLARYEESQATLTTALELATTEDQEAQVQIQQLHLWLARKDDASIMDHMSKSMQLAKCRPQIYSIMAHFYRARQDHDTSRQMLQAAAEKVDRPHVSLSIIQCHLDLHDYTAATTDLATHLTKYGPSVRYHLLAAHLRKVQGDHHAAIDQYRQVLTLEQGHGTALLQISQLYLDLGQLERARTTAETMLEHHLKISDHRSAPSSVRAAYRKLFIIARRMGDRTLSASLLERLLDCDPHHQESYMSTIEHARDQGTTADVEQAIKEFVQAHPDSPQAHVQLGLYYRQCGIHDRALIALQIAADLSEGSPAVARPYVLLIQEYILMGNLEKAQLLWDKIPAERHTLDSHLLGLELSDQQHTSDYRRLFTIYGPRPELLHAWSRTLQDQRRYHDAVEVYDHAKQKTMRMMLHMAQLEHLAERPQEANALYQQLLTHHHSHKAIVLAYSQFLLQRGLLSESHEIVSRGLSLWRDDPDLLQRYGAILFRQCNISAYADSTRDTASAHPHHYGCQIALCQLLLREGKYAETREALLALSPTSMAHLHKLHQMLAQTYMRQYKYADAQREFCTALHHRDHYAHDYLQLAMVQMAQREILEARATLLQATSHLHESAVAGRTIIPTRSHIHKMINDLRARPDHVKILASKDTQDSRWAILRDLVRADPWYLGSGIYTCLHLREIAYWEECMSANHAGLDPIPRRIIQYWNGTALPHGIRRVAEQLQDNHPDYTYVRYSKKIARSFLRTHFTERVQRAFELCKHAAMESDYFRLACLYVHGGFYVDVDDLSIRSFEQLRTRGFQFIAHQEDLGSIGNNLIGCTARHPIIKMALDQATETLQAYANEGPWFQTGPALLSSAIAAHIVASSTSLSPAAMPIAILSASDYRAIIFPHLPLPYKNTDASWFHRDYHVTLSASSLSSSSAPTVKN